ncbi:MAG TPA: peptidoglycan-binding protein [Pyrinomonadaceae bacterium]|jgi:chitosanase
MLELTEQQKDAAQAIVNIFETGRVLGDYASVVSVNGDPGGLTYGKSQTTLNSGNLYLLIKAYTEAEGAIFADALRPYLERLRNQNQSLNTNLTLRNILHRAGVEDGVMLDTQDKFFDRVYWTPAISRAGAIGVETALGATVVYDSIIHGSWVRIRDRTIDRHGRLSNVGEKPWISHYIDVRREWLANHSVPLLRRTVYRMDALRQLIRDENWDLRLPFTVRGLLINEHTLTPVVVGRPVDSPRLLLLRNPFMTGEDVRRLQQALIAKNVDIGDDGADGVFGPATDAAVKAFQESRGLVVDGIVGASTRAALEIDND